MLQQHLERRFSKDSVKEIIDLLLSDELLGKTCSSNNDENLELCKCLSVKIKDRLKNHIPSDYKIVCQVVLGDMRGAGLRMSCRCLWDSTTDAVVYTSYENYY
ncbi:hypothetical protein PGB90_005422 [Kerria lacca]